ncbi:MAG: MazG family protein, partial [Deltaproteobacteria bacterium]|nr:MazG family protein [Deltaproteobacteria bacterium]
MDITAKKGHKKSPKAAYRKRKSDTKKSVEAEKSLGEVMALVARLRAKDGCPWDREQTHLSLKPALLEEAYELLEAIEKGDPKELAGELGDLLLQVVFHCQIAAEARRFTLRDVILGLKDKLIRRHPHVFAEPRLTDTTAVLRQRASIKAKENKPAKHASTSLGDLPRAMPALARAQRITERD